VLDLSFKARLGPAGGLRRGFIADMDLAKGSSLVDQDPDAQQRWPSRVVAFRPSIS